MPLTKSEMKFLYDKKIRQGMPPKKAYDEVKEEARKLNEKEKEKKNESKI